MHLQVLEGTWEEIAQHADKLAGHRVRVTVLPPNRITVAAEKRPIPVDPPMPTEEDGVPFDFHRSQGITVTTRLGGRRRPDPAMLRELLGES